MRSKSLWALAIVGVVVVAITAVYASQQQMVLEVRLGEKGEKGDKRDGDEHSISIEALRGGQTKFWVEGKHDTMFLVDLQLPPEQIRSFSQGTALMVDAVPAAKAEAGDESAVNGWIVKTGAEVSMIVTLQLTQQSADESGKANMPPITPPGGGAGGGW